MVRVQIKVEVQGRGTTKAWWGRFPGLAEAGEGSDRRVVTTGEPSWLPRIKDGEAWIDLQPGTVIRAGVTHFGGYRRAQVSSPPLIVEEGREWTAVDRDGTRHVRITITGARVATFEDLNSSPAEPSPLSPHSDDILIQELERRGYVVIRATADTGAQ